MRHMPAAMVHGGGGVLLMMTTKFLSQKQARNQRKNIDKRLQCGWTD
jgi:hypothetical protein